MELSYFNKTPSFLKRALLFKKSDLRQRGNFRENFDVFVSSVLGCLALLLLSPLMILIAISLLVFNGAPVFYAQTRVGKNSKLFTVYKFRTMKINAERDTGPVLSSKGDDRLTKVGRFLKESYLDELPQLFNVIRGEMAFIGPRPERPYFTMQYLEEDEGYGERLKVRPGITGLAQVMLPYDAFFSEKLIFDSIYINARSRIFINSLIVLFTVLKIAQVPYQKFSIYRRLWRDFVEHGV